VALGEPLAAGRISLTWRRSMRRWWSCSAERGAGFVLEDCGDWAASGSAMVSAIRTGKEREDRRLSTEGSSGCMGWVRERHVTGCRVDGQAI
jgi:hypothetical protein